MLQRDDLLRLARIINYDRYVTPSLGMFSKPGFEYEYVSAAIYKQLDNGCYCITWQNWMKAIVGSPFDPHINQTEMLSKMQQNEVRAKKMMLTSELKTMLETLPLQFKFESGTRVVVLPKLINDQHNVYVKWSTDRNLYANQYSLTPGRYEYQHWFNEQFNPIPKTDWRYFLSLGPEEATNDLYKFFEGVYTGEVEDLVKGTEIYMKDFGVFIEPVETKSVVKRIRLQRNLRPKSKSRPNNAAEEQQMVCIKDPKNGNIIRIAKFFTGKFIKNGFTYASKEEYKTQQKLRFEKRKDMATGNMEAQILKYKAPRSERKLSKPKNVAGSPYERFQTIIKETYDKKIKIEKTKHGEYEIRTVSQEEIKVKRIIPQYKYEPLVWEVWSFRYGMKEDSKGIPHEHRWKDKLLETIPFLDKDGKPIVKKVFIENIEEWVTIIRDIPITRKTIKVLQIPSKKSVGLKTMLAEWTPRKNKDSIPMTSTIRTPRTKYLLSVNKKDELRWKELYSEFKIEPVYKTYTIVKRNNITKHDSIGKVVNLVRRKLVS